MSNRDDYKPIPCIEDVSVPVGQLSNYVRDIIEVMRRFGTKAAFYGHASAGCLHIRPLVNLKREDGVRIMEELTEQALGLAIRYGGVLSGEHGDGLQRSHLNEKLFGTKLYNAMKELKAAFDPDGIFNPGKVVDGSSNIDDLRYGKDYKTTEIKTYLDWSSDKGLSGAVEMCNGQGVCRKLDEGIMCPSYIATRDERDTTRARANALRAVVSGTVPIEQLSSKEMHGVFDLCISCKACKTECPSGVDVAKMKIEFLANYNSAHGISVRDRLFAYVHETSRIASPIAPLANLISSNRVARLVLSKLGIHPNRSLPLLSNEKFTDWFKNRPDLHKNFINFLQNKTDVKTVLEVGCGNGAYPIKFKELFLNKEYEGIDIGKPAIEYCNKNSNFKFILGDFIKMKIDKKRDLVFSLTVIDHVYDIEGFLSKIVQACKKYAFVSSYRGYFPDKQKHSMLWVNSKGCYFNDLSVKEIKRTLRKNGLSEDELTRQNAKYEKLEYSFDDDDRAIVDDFRQGKLVVFVHKGKLLGGIIVAMNAGELFQELVLANSANLDIKEIFNKLINLEIDKKIDELNAHQNELNDLLNNYMLTGETPRIVNEKLEKNLKNYVLFTIYQQNIKNF
ncbi:MAG: methyltransferase domain-containing protein [Bacteroidetes bacterium]|nr:methyltransferase domain-containing protein [Bacteroidota bacterium]